MDFADGWVLVKFQSTLPTRGSDSALYFSFCAERCISIHAPHEGERRSILLLPSFHFNFNPRSPRGGATCVCLYATAFNAFQSTLPTRGSDLSRLSIQYFAAVFQSTLPTRGSDVHDWVCGTSQIRISIHAPHEGERLILWPKMISSPKFQSTLPTRGSDGIVCFLPPLAFLISIHAPHEGERL